MCTPSTWEMYRTVNIDDPETFPGTFNEQETKEDSIHVVPMDDKMEAADAEAVEEDKEFLEQNVTVKSSGSHAIYKRLAFWRQALAALAANMVHLSGGFAAGFSAPTMAAIQKELNLDDSTKNWFASILVVGQILGCIAGGLITDIFGRRRVLIVFLSLSFIGWSIVSASTMHPDKGMAVAFIFTGRFLHGLADSLGVSPAIIMVSEVTTVRLRGMFMNTATIAASSGIPLAYVIGSFLSWQTTALIGGCFPLFGAMIFLTFVPSESPVFLMSKGKREESLASLTWYRHGYTKEKIANESKGIEDSTMSSTNKDSNNTEAQNTTKKSWLAAFMKEETLRPLIIVVTLLGLGPLTGVMSVTFFAMELLEGLGFGESTLFVAVTAGTLRAIGCAVAGIIVVFKGRRFVLLFSCFGAIVAIEVATLSMLFKEHYGANVVCDYVLIVSIPAYMFFLGIGMSPVPWILLGEWFVSETRSLAGGIASAMFFVSALASLQMTGLMERTIGIHGMFTSFGFVCILFAVIALKFVPETSGKSYKDAVLLKKYQDTTWFQEKALTTAA